MHIRLSAAVFTLLMAIVSAAGTYTAAEEPRLGAPLTAFLIAVEAAFGTFLAVEDEQET